MLPKTCDNAKELSQGGVKAMGMHTAEEGRPVGCVPGKMAVGEAPASTACAAGPLAAQGIGAVAEAPA